jgi:hypothetical protein
MNASFVVLATALSGLAATASFTVVLGLYPIVISQYSSSTL